MRFVALSDHAGEMLADARRRRACAQGRAEQRYRRELAAYQERVGQAREREARARKQGGLLSRLWLGLAALWRRGDQAPPPPLPPSLPSDGEAAIAGGVKGEQEVAVALDSALDDGWVLVKGYRNRRGEIDYLVLGPGGLFAIEVKYVNGTFRITRDTWRYVKYDNYGNPVEQREVADRGGRPPNARRDRAAGRARPPVPRRGPPRLTARQPRPCSAQAPRASYPGHSITGSRG
jgi:Nuclease-related domain